MEAAVFRRVQQLATSRDGSVVVGEKRLDEDGGDECGLPACGCTGFS